MSNDTSLPLSFRDLGLIEPLFKALKDIGYETPSPIQAQTIPYILNGKDVLGQAQTGTGKTAAFALPILSRIDLKQKDTQVLVLAPTRELACTAHLWRSRLRYAATPAQTWGASGCGHAWTRDGSYAQRHAETG